MIAASAPTFWFGLLMLYLFALKLRWFPAIGMYSPGREGDLLNLLRHVPLPALSACLISVAVAVAAIMGPGMMNVMLAMSIALLPCVTRIVHVETVRILRMDFIEAATVCGTGRTRLLFREPLPNVVGRSSCSARPRSEGCWCSRRASRRTAGMRLHSRAVQTQTEKSK